MPLFLGLDTGTSGTRALLMDETGALIASATHDYPLSTPHPQWAEQHPDFDWWNAAKIVIPAVLQKANVGGDAVAGVGLTGQMHGSVFLDKNGSVLRPALLWCDARTARECDEITAAVGGTEKLFQMIGQPVLASFTAPKIVWLRNHEPEIYAQVAQVLLPKDYIRYRLTGDYAAEVSDASGTSLFDVRARNWSQPMLDALQIPRDWLPPVSESPAVTGKISEIAARETGLVAGTPVVGGGGDQAAGAVGCGIVRAGMVSSTVGTSGVVFAHADEAFFDPQMRIQTFCHATPGRWHMMGCVLSAGGSLRWFRDTFAPDVSFDDLTREAMAVAPGCEGLFFLPYLTGERTPHPDPDARGVFFGETLRMTRGSHTRAVLEGVAYALQDNFALLAEIGVPVRSVRASGGGAKSPFWLQIQADVTNHTHTMPNTDEGPAYGAAILAAVGTGAFATVEEACEAIVHDVASTEPDAANHAIYARHHAIYRTLYPALKRTFADVSQLTNAESFR